MVVLAAAEATATGDDDLGRGQFGALGLRQFPADEGTQAEVGAGDHRLDRGTAALAGCVEAGRAYRDHLDGVCALDGLQGIARIDGVHEGVGIDDGNDVGDLGDVEQGGHARQGVLAVTGRGRQDVGVAGGQGQD